MAAIHPRLDDWGKQVVLKHPSSPTPLASWSDPAAAATVVPDGPMPADLNGVAFEAVAMPAGDAWSGLAAAGQAFTERDLKVPASLKPAAGVAIEEPDGRFWLVSPSNQFGGYVNTFPKGRKEPGLSLRATAIKEALEESGLLVELTGFLLDAKRSTTMTRYYRARRIGGTPSAAGWESQAVHLVPRAQLPSFLTAQGDALLLAALLAG